MLLHYLARARELELEACATEISHRAAWYDARSIDRLERELTTARARLSSTTTAATAAR